MTTADTLSLSIAAFPEPQTAEELLDDAPRPKVTHASPLPVAPRVRAPRCEPLTPFVTWSPDARGSQPLCPALASEPSLVDGFLSSPEIIIERLLTPAAVPTVVMAAALVTAASAALYETAIVFGFHLPSLLPVLVGPCMVLLAEAAAVGPIYAASILDAARVPVARLGAAILAASATGALLLAALAPALFVVIGYDREWLGPLMMVGAFALAGFVSGRRLHRLLLGMAESLYQREAGATARLSPLDAARAGRVARVACMVVGATLALACWTSSGS